MGFDRLSRHMHQIFHLVSDNFTAFELSLKFLGQQILINQNLKAVRDEPAKFTFTLADAGSAICSYDTEYRDCITEQFTDACVEYAYKYMPACKNMLHLPARIFNAY